MIYVFDTSPLIALFTHFYPARFPTLWEKFDKMQADGSICSVRDALKEIEGSSSGRLLEWGKANRKFFLQPDAEELNIVAEIFQVDHFQAMIRTKERLTGKPVADPFVIAKGKQLGGCVVTLEKLKNNAAKIPNVCQHFEVNCMNLEQFMEAEGWEF